MKKLLALTLLVGCSKPDPCAAPIARVDAARTKMQGSTRSADYTEFINAANDGQRCLIARGVDVRDELRDAMFSAVRFKRAEIMESERRQEAEQRKRLESGQRPADRKLQGLGL